MENIKIIIASDSIGETAELVARACILNSIQRNVNMNF